MSLPNSSSSSSVDSISSGSGSVSATAASRVASSIPSITISRQTSANSLLGISAAAAATTTTTATSSSVIFGKNFNINSLTSMSSIPPVIHTYSRPRILARGREVSSSRTPGKILQHQTPPTRNSIAPTSTGEFGKSLHASSSNSSSATNHHNSTQSIIMNNSHPIANNNKNNATGTNLYYNNINNILATSTPTATNSTAATFLIGTSPPCTSPPASKLVVRIPSLSPAAEAAAAAVQMQIGDIQVVDEAEMENEMVESVVEVEIDYQTLVALNDMQPAEEQETFVGVQDTVELEIDDDTTTTTVVLDVDSSSSNNLDNGCEVESTSCSSVSAVEDEATEIIDFVQLNAIEDTSMQQQSSAQPALSQHFHQEGEEGGEEPEELEIISEEIVVPVVDDAILPTVHHVDQVQEDDVCEQVELAQDTGQQSIPLEVISEKVIVDLLDHSASVSVVDDATAPVEENREIVDNEETQISVDITAENEETQISVDITAENEDAQILVEIAAENEDAQISAAENEDAQISVEIAAENEDAQISVEIAEIAPEISVEIADVAPQISVEIAEVAPQILVEIADVAPEEVNREHSGTIINIDGENEKVVGEKVPVNEFETPIVEPAKPETANISVEDPSATICAGKTLEKPDPDEIELTGNAALQLTNGLPESNLKEESAIQPALSQHVHQEEEVDEDHEEVGKVQEVKVGEEQEELEIVSEVVVVPVVDDVILPVDQVQEDVVCEQVELAQHNDQQSEPESMAVISEKVVVDLIDHSARIDVDDAAATAPVEQHKEPVENEDTQISVVAVVATEEESGEHRGTIVNVDDDSERMDAAKAVLELANQIFNSAKAKLQPAKNTVPDPPATFCAGEILDDTSDEIEQKGKAALQWQNGLGSLPGSNLKFKMNDLGMLEMVVQEDENENEINADADVVSAEGGGNCEKHDLKMNENEDDLDSKSDSRSGSRSPEYYTKPPPKAQFSIMSNMKNSNPIGTLVKTPLSSPDFKDSDLSEDEHKEDIQTCMWCGRFGLKTELTNSKCTPCIEAAKVKAIISSPGTSRKSRSGTNSEDSFKVPSEKYVPKRSIYPIIPRNTMSMKLKHLTETITTTMTNSAAIVLGIKDKAIMETLNAGIGLSCSKFVEESRLRNAAKNGNNGVSKKKCSGGGVKSTAFFSKNRKRNFPQVLSKRMPQLDSPEKSGSEESDTAVHNEMPKLKSNALDFDWQKYMVETKTKAAPQRLFRQPAFPPENLFRDGMLLEAIDPQHQSLFCVVTVVETQGYRIRLRFIGFSEAYDFWMNADSLEIFPCGWCEENNYRVEPPPGFSTPFNYKKVLREKKIYSCAPKSLFSITNEELTDSGVKVGMKLEAVDIRNQNLVCVATVANVMGDRFLVHFDSWDTLYDYWTDLTSPFIHPVGWCTENDVPLTPPNNIKTGFVWENYLRSTKTTAMPAKLFQPLPPVGFKKGMKVECVDKRNPFLVRAATVSEIEGHELLIHFDNWDSIYDYKVYELSPDIHPAGWCTHTGHALQSPPQMDKEWEGPCQTFGCFGLGHIRGPKFLTHNTEKNCPYSFCNYNKDRMLADRMIVYERTFGLSEKEPIPEAKPKINRKLLKKNPPATRKSVSCVKRKRGSATQSEEESDVKLPVPPTQEKEIDIKQNTWTQENSTSTPSCANNSNQNLVPFATSQQLQTANGASMLIIVPTAVPFGQPPFISGQPVQTTVPFTPDFKDASIAKRRRLSQASSSSVSVTANADEEAFITQDQNYHDNLLKRLIDRIGEKDVCKWKTEDLVDFVSRIPGCREAANLFAEHFIDGESFLLLNQSDLITVMGFKMGPAVKITNAIRLINHKRNCSGSPP